MDFGSLGKEVENCESLLDRSSTHQIKNLNEIYTHKKERRRFYEPSWRKKEVWLICAHSVKYNRGYILICYQHKNGGKAKADMRGHILPLSDKKSHRNRCTVMPLLLLLLFFLLEWSAAISCGPVNDICQSFDSFFFLPVYNFKNMYA